MAEFIIIKTMDEIDVVDFRNRLVAWLSERLGAHTKYEDGIIFQAIITAEKWVVTVNTIMGKFRQWSVHYAVEIFDDVMAIEFALSKDTI